MWWILWGLKILLKQKIPHFFVCFFKVIVVNNPSPDLRPGYL